MPPLAVERLVVVPGLGAHELAADVELVGLADLEGSHERRF